MGEPIVIVTLIMGVIELLLTIALFYVGAKANRIDKLEETIGAKAEAVVDARFQVLAMEFKGLVGQLRTVIEGIEKRLERGDAAFDRQDELQRKLEIQAEQRLAHCTRAFASKQEVNDLSAEIRKLEVKLARFEERIGQACKER